MITTETRSPPGDAASLRRVAALRLHREPGHWPDDPLYRPDVGDHALSPGTGPGHEEMPARRAAAVLVPIVDRPEGLTMLLTQRSAHLPSHAGQVAFPGGKIEPEDASPLAAALREAEEEIGLAPEHVELLGYLDSYLTGTGYRVVPVVALVRPGFTLRLDPGEVEAAFEVPLGFLMDPGNHQRHSGIWRDKLRIYYAMPYGDRYIWGATAGMLRNLYERLTGP